MIRLSQLFAVSLANILNGIISEESPLQGPTPEEPEPVPEETYPEPDWPEPVSDWPESVPEEPEPTPEETEPVPDWTEPVPDEPEPTPEETYPEPDWPEPVPDEPESVPDEPKTVPDELPAEGDSEQWTIPQVPADADGWPRASLLPGETPKTEILQEAPDQGHIVRISYSELNLYENWESLSSKRRAKRVRKLISRGLPIPSETGFISIVAA